jgi:hypothetical protein
VFISVIITGRRSGRKESGLSEVQFLHLSEVSEENHRTPENDHSPGRNSKRTPLEYRPRVLLLDPIVTADKQSLNKLSFTRVLDALYEC